MIKPNEATERYKHIGQRTPGIRQRAHHLEIPKNL